MTKPSPAMRQAMANAEVLMMMQIHSDDNACSIMHILDTFHVYMKRLKGNHKKLSFLLILPQQNTALLSFVCSCVINIIWFGHTKALLLKKMMRNGNFSCPAETDPYMYFL